MSKAKELSELGDAVTVDSGNVGIGTSPTAFGAGYTNCQVTGTSGAGVFRATSTSVDVRFQADQVGLSGLVNVASNHPLVFNTNAAERMRILSSGGLTFNGDTASANALDDYEEGTWTPTLSGTGYSFGTNSGAYVKVGRMVYATAKLNVTTVGTNNASVTMSGFPFTAYNSPLFHQVGMVRQSSTTGRIYVVQINSNSTSGAINAMDGIVNGDNEIITTGDYAVSITYMTS